MVLRKTTHGVSHRLTACVRVSREARLAAEAEAHDEGAVALDVVAAQVVEHAPALAHQHQQAAAGVVVLLVDLQVLLQVADALGEERHLDFRRARILLVAGVIRDDGLLLLSCEWHPRSASCSERRPRGQLPPAGSPLVSPYCRASKILPVSYGFLQAGSTTGGPVAKVEHIPLMARIAGR